MHKKKILIAGILLGGLAVGGIWIISNSQYNEAKLFAHKERCAVYTEKRQAETNETRTLTGYSYSVQGFYSPVANTCMTNSIEIALEQHYIQRTLIDELTGKTEAFAFAATGREFNELSFDGKQEQIAQDRLFRERLLYFQGDN